MSIFRKYKEYIITATVGIFTVIVLLLILSLMFPELFDKFVSPIFVGLITSAIWSFLIWIFITRKIEIKEKKVEEAKAMITTKKGVEFRKISENVLEAIGNTSIVQLNKVVPPDHARVLVKLEWENPTGSMKDRMAQAMIAEAEKDARLKKGGTVVEYTGGSTGTSLALICAVKGYRLRIVSSDAFSKDKIDHMKTLGAEVTIIPSRGGGITKKLIDEIIETARKFSEKPGTYWTDQLNNADHVAGYYSLGEEIWEQTNGQIDAFVHCVGTAASLKGTSTVLRNYKPDLKVFAVEPAESPVLSGGKSGSHGIGGIGIGFLPPLWDPSLVDDIIRISTNEAKEMARRLAREEGLCAGISSGANVVAAIKVAEKLGPKTTVVTLLVDSGLKYLSTDLYKT